mgnify:FL=1
MKSKLSWLLFLLLLLLGSGLFAQQQLTVEVIHCQGPLFFRGPEKPPDAWEVLTVGTCLGVGTTIRVGDTSSAELILADFCLHLNPETQLILKNLAVEGETLRVELHLLSGGIWSKIMKTLHNLLHYEVVTPTAVAGVEGTIFSVDYLGEATEILVAEGTVAVRDRIGRKVTLLAKEKVKVTSSGIFHPALNAEDKERIERMKQWGQAQDDILHKSDVSKTGQQITAPQKGSNGAGKGASGKGGPK